MFGRLTLATACFALASALPAFGQVALPFVDDFETGTLLPGDAPPGKWSSTKIAPGDSLFASDAGAHGGVYGLRAVDTVPNESIQPAQLYAPFQRDAGNLYVREWVRVLPTADAGYVMLALLWDNVRAQNIVEIAVNFPGPVLQIGGNIAPTGWAPFSSGISLPLRTWHLIEGAVLNGGSSSATLWLWLDGVAMVQDAGLNHTGFMADLVATGEVGSDGFFVGTIETDDVAVTAVPPASKLRLDAGAGPFAEGACIPVEVALYSSAGPPAVAVRPEPLSFGVTGSAASFYSDPSCGSSAQAVIGIGQSRTVIGMRADAGTLSLSVASVDLFGDSTALSVGPGSGGTPVAGLYDVSCDCSASGGPSAVALVIACVARAMRRPYSRRRALLGMVRRRVVRPSGT